MSELRKILLPIIKRLPLSEPILKDEWTTSEHLAQAKKMSEEELDERRVYYFDRWCWDTADSDDLMASHIYEAHLASNRMMRTLVDDLVAVQPMSSPVAQIGTLNYRYGDKSSDEV